MGAFKNFGKNVGSGFTNAYNKYAPVFSADKGGIMRGFKEKIQTPAVQQSGGNVKEILSDVFSTAATAFDGAGDRLPDLPFPTMESLNLNSSDFDIMDKLSSMSDFNISELKGVNWGQVKEGNFDSIDIDKFLPDSLSGEEALSGYNIPLTEAGMTPSYDFGNVSAEDFIKGDGVAYNINITDVISDPKISNTITNSGIDTSSMNVSFDANSELNKYTDIMNNESVKKVTSFLGVDGDLDASSILGEFGLSTTGGDLDASSLTGTIAKNPEELEKQVNSGFNSSLFGGDIGSLFSNISFSGFLESMTHGLRDMENYSRGPSVVVDYDLGITNPRDIGNAFDGADYADLNITKFSFKEIFSGDMPNLSEGFDLAGVASAQGENLSFAKDYVKDLNLATNLPENFESSAEWITEGNKAIFDGQHDVKSYIGRDKWGDQLNMESALRQADLEKLYSHPDGTPPLTAMEAEEKRALEEMQANLSEGDKFELDFNEQMKKLKMSTADYSSLFDF